MARYRSKTIGVYGSQERRPMTEKELLYRKLSAKQSNYSMYVDYGDKVRAKQAKAEISAIKKKLGLK